MKKVIIFFIFLISIVTFSQGKKQLQLAFISKNYKLGFRLYNKEFNMYQKPYILKGRKKNKIQGYDDANYSGGNILSISPNKKYIVLDYISKGYVDDGTNKTLYENYLCVIVDVSKKLVVKEMQEDCGENWNENNEWVNNGQLIFDGNE